ncbi:MAG TPA: hypothetical protein PK539_04060 [Candidatus Paceibacterota bacterium]|nr:hypothetical protein [Candidatus Paceibacterota bacterium]
MRTENHGLVQEVDMAAGPTTSADQFRKLVDEALGAAEKWHIVLSNTRGFI